MEAIKKFYRLFCKAEEAVVALCICAITLLIFTSAIMRTINHPINWAQDFSLLLFAWLVFLGADVALRRSEFLRVDILMNRLPEKLQAFLWYLWYVAAILFFCILLRYGVPLALANVKRPFGSMAISYSWATISVPIGSALMIITIIIKIVSRIKKIASAKEYGETI